MKIIQLCLYVIVIIYLSACSDSNDNTTPISPPDKSEPKEIEIVINSLKINAISEPVEVQVNDTESVYVQVDAIKGIPFASAERFQHSSLMSLEEIGNEQGVFDASSFGKICPQRNTELAISEDCLNLNIWRPNGTSVGDSLPVYVYFHGGSFEKGSGSELSTIPDLVVAQSFTDTLTGDRTEPFIAVSFNYRLGLFGTLWLEDNGDTKGGNFAIGDQKRALEWIHKNISFFGGDPLNITTYGQGSGATSINLLHQGHNIELDPNENDNAVSQYFQRSIMQSNPLGIPLKSYSMAKKTTDTVNQIAIDLFAEDENEVNLVDLSTSEILEIQVAVQSQITGRLFGLEDGVIENIITDLIDGTSLAIIAVKYAKPISEIEPRSKMITFAPYIEQHRECINSGLLGCREYADYDGYHVMKQAIETTLKVPSVIGFNSEESNPYTSVFKIPFLINIEILGFNIIDLITSILSSAVLPVEINNFIPYSDESVNIPVYQIISTIWYLDNTDALSYEDFLPVEDDTTLAGAAENMKRFNNLNNNLLYKCPAINQIESTIEQNEEVAVSLYHFDYVSGFNVGNNIEGSILSALGSISCFYGKPCNAAELPFIFSKAFNNEGNQLETTNRDRALMTKMSRLWFSDMLFEQSPYSITENNAFYIGVETDDIDTLRIEPVTDWDLNFNSGADTNLTMGTCKALN